MPEQLEGRLSVSQNADRDFAHQGIRGDGGRRGERRNKERDVIREQDKEDQVRQEGKKMEGIRPLTEKDRNG